MSVMAEERRQGHRQRETLPDAFTQIVSTQHGPGQERYIDVPNGTLYASYFDPTGVEAGEDDLDLRGMGPIEGHHPPASRMYEKLHEFEAELRSFRFFADWFDGQPYAGKIEFLPR